MTDDVLHDVRLSTLLSSSTDEKRQRGKKTTTRKISTYYLTQHLRKLQEALTNELAAPTLLQHETRSMNILGAWVTSMEEKKDEKEISIKKNDDDAGRKRKRSDHNNNEEEECAKEMDLDRVKFALKEYTRTRLRKVERYARHWLLQRETSGLDLSSEEWVHAEKYEAARESLLKKMVLSRIGMSEAFGSLDTQDEQDIVRRPPVSTFVLFQANADLGDVVVVRTPGEPEQSVPIQRGTILTGQWELVEPFVRSGQASLI